MKNGLGVRRRLALDIFSSIEDKRIAAHELRTIMWEATLRCNLACRHCGSDCRSEAAVPDMPAADFLRTIDTITPHVVPNRVLIVITGGEALMRRDIEEVGRALYDRGYPWGIVTNGMLLDERRLESLLRAGLHTATVSLDGFAETHNRIRRNERSYERALGALRLLARQPDILYDAVTCANADTLATLPRRQYINGLAESVKASLLADPELFAIFEKGDIDAQIGEIICRSLRFKKGIVEQDETEHGMRKALNFGHTIGHGIEAVKGIKGRRTVGLYHGECVALGMLPMIESKALQKRVRAVYRRLGLPTRTTYDKEKVLAEMLHDKKAQSGQITIIKVPGLGCWRAETIPVEGLRPLLGIEE